jgi:hypothetical protein
MQEASPEDEPKESDGKDDDLPKQDKPPNSPPAPGQPKNPFVSNSSKPSTNSNNQTQAYSMPNLKVGSITCPSPVHSEVGFWSQGKKVAPRRLWGDCSSEDDDDLPSPLPRLISDVDVSVGEPLGVPTVTGKTEVFSATEQSAVAASIDDKTMEDTTEKFPGLVLDAHGLGGRGVVHPHLDASGKVIGASDSSVRACNKGMGGYNLQGQESPVLIDFVSSSYFLSPGTNATSSFSENLEPTLVSTMAQKGAHEDGLVGNTFSSPVMSPKYTSVMLNGGMFDNSLKEQHNPILPVSEFSTISNSNIHEFTGTNVNAAGTGVYLGGRYSREEIVAFGGISEKEMAIRSSARIRSQPNADVPQMERAQKLTQAKNEVSGSGTYSKFSLASLSNDTVISRAEKLGVSLGKSPRQIENSINFLKETDNTRTLVMLAKNLKEISDEEDQHAILSHASDLSLDLIGEEHHVEEEDTFTFVKPKVTRVYKRKQKVAPKMVRRSTRLSKK